MKTSSFKSSVLGTALVISGIFLNAVPASADLLWNWSYHCSLLDTQTKCEGGSGTFVTGELQSGPSPYYVVSEMTGTVEGNTITSLLPPNSLGYNNDNWLDQNFGQPIVWATSKITGIAFLTNNDSATRANVNLLFSNAPGMGTGPFTQIGGPNNLALLDIDFSGRIVGEVDPVGPDGNPVAIPEPGSVLYFVLGLSVLGLLSVKRFQARHWKAAS